MTHAHITAPQPLLSTTVRAIAAIGVAAVIGLVGAGTAQASHTAVETCAQSFARTAHVQVVQLPKVEVVARRAA
ncbi:hypothetical protein [Caenimonas koreensis]|uniref:Uncharacterized protein n=1 Tax=Caenimonas koreensis DSM 17982 TaxID=1121255 RepID=A0A844AYX4_9BURK|nr:hypothetical protein [Caenimonas koreensis]MRD49555.1 hypothetical protein [Caenimonas koreensis DSM 17982]